MCGKRFLCGGRVYCVARFILRFYCLPRYVVKGSCVVAEVYCVAIYMFVV